MIATTKSSGFAFYRRRVRRTCGVLSDSATAFSATAFSATAFSATTFSVAIIGVTIRSVAIFGVTILSVDRLGATIHSAAIHSATILSAATSFSGATIIIAFGLGGHQRGSTGLRAGVRHYRADAEQPEGCWGGERGHKGGFDRVMHLYPFSKWKWYVLINIDDFDRRGTRNPGKRTFGVQMLPTTIAQFDPIQAFPNTGLRTIRCGRISASSGKTAILSRVIGAVGG
ncbi:hypothetical protein ACTWPB_16635 [Nocardia sp. IBHARD005]|uniref:hypothetical protein n=1 Tax=Nocardia sp. IBHARD005 TaxID=3457765 RepID=UPI004059F112